MLAATPPFSDPDGEDMATFANILKGEISFPPEDGPGAFSPAARALIGRLCTVKVADRLGYLKGGAEDLITHEWFAASRFDWDGLISRFITPPWLPALKGVDDNSQFDEEGQAQCTVDDPLTATLTPEEASEWSHVWDAFARDGPT